MLNFFLKSPLLCFIVVREKKFRLAGVFPVWNASSNTSLENFFCKRLETFGDLYILWSKISDHKIDFVKKSFLLPCYNTRSLDLVSFCLKQASKPCCWQWVGDLLLTGPFHKTYIFVCYGCLTTIYRIFTSLGGILRSKFACNFKSMTCSSEQISWVGPPKNG